jgi:hypothetical protein
MPPIDCIYIAASAHDARYTRICVASIRFFYPHIPIRLLPGGRLQADLVRELRQYWDVELAELAEEGDYGWGFVKLETLFGPSGQRFLVLDSDTVITGPVLDLWSDSRSSFLVDDEQQPEDRAREIYYDWEKVRGVDPSAQPPRFLFNTGQWFGTAGVLTREDFAPWILWTMPRTTTPPNTFMNGDQGLLNYVFNQKVILQSLQVERRQIMRWPAHSTEGLDADTVAKGAGVPRIVHWAGLKKARQRDMLAADLLRFFEGVYYSRLPAGSLRRLFAVCEHAISHAVSEARAYGKLAIQKYGGALAKLPQDRALTGTK